MPAVTCQALVFHVAAIKTPAEFQRLVDVALTALKVLMFVTDICRVPSFLCLPDFGLERTDPEVEEFEPNNLRNPKFFPAYKDCAMRILHYKAYSVDEEEPPRHHWCLLGEILEDGNLVHVVKDKDGE
ncbi:hypothetical protein DFH09DRAFT_1092892 [Mycena vulgaris]|nr:hypothetical protein DFH09DRAFT_1092892 [Mycena vulgaris]